jgi:hypothetical protein
MAKMALQTREMMHCWPGHLDKQRQPVLPSSIRVLVVRAVDWYGSDELNARFVYVVVYCRITNIGASYDDEGSIPDH